MGFSDAVRRALSSHLVALIESSRSAVGAKCDAVHATVVKELGEIGVNVNSKTHLYTTSDATITRREILPPRSRARSPEFS